MNFEALAATVSAAITDVPDFPKEGILFKDISTVLQRPEAFRAALSFFEHAARDSDADAIIGLESRGFLFGAPVAATLGLPFVLARKPGKLPRAVVQAEYELEYGTDALEMHTDALGPATRALIVDDLIATGGTAEAAGKLVRKVGGVVAGYAFLLELDFLKGRERLDATIHSLIHV